MRRTFLLHHLYTTSALLIGTIAWCALSPILSQGQSVTTNITASGLGTQVPLQPPSNGVYNITGGTRVDTNLFHSFGQFSVGPGDVANFQNTLVNGVFPHTDNILARVTGTNGNNPTFSSIYGTIQTTGFLNANLFLMNPAGFLFGPNATVNVGGMVAFTTADYLRLSKLDGSKQVC
jgi:filamentous hemagglutinin family protein